MKKIEDLFDDVTEFDEENAPYCSAHLTESDDLIGWAGGNKFTTIPA